MGGLVMLGCSWIPHG